MHAGEFTSNFRRNSKGDEIMKANTDELPTVSKENV